MKITLLKKYPYRRIKIHSLLFFLLIFLFINNNKALGSVAVTVKFYIQGYYIGNDLMAPVLYNQCIGSGLSQASCSSQYPITDVDNVTIELRDQFSYLLVSGGSFTGRVHTDGTIACSFSVPADLYYIVVIYKNTLQTWSKFPVSLSSTSQVYDFSLSSNKAYNDNQTNDFYIHSDAYGNPDPAGGVGGLTGSVSIDGKYKIFSGDIADPAIGMGYQDRVIESQDFADEENAVYNMAAGYYSEDLNGDGAVDLLDMLIMERSVYYVYYSIIPH